MIVYLVSVRFASRGSDHGLFAIAVCPDGVFLDPAATERHAGTDALLLCPLQFFGIDD